MNFNIKEEKYEAIKSDFKKHIYNNIKHLNINNNNIDDDMEKIYDGIDNIFNIILCGTQILKNTIYEIKHINGQNRKIYPTDILGKGKYGHNKKYDSEEEYQQKKKNLFL